MNKEIEKKPYQYYEFWIFLVYIIFGYIYEDNRAGNLFVSSLWFSMFLYEKLKYELKGEKWLKRQKKGDLI